MTQPHRGHLYQVARRSGVPAVTVSLVHWAFALFGGLCCVLFVDASGNGKLAILLLVVPPQLVWLCFVMRRARRAGLGRWG